MEKQRPHLRALEAIDNGLREAEQITIEDGIRDAIEKGRMTAEVGSACLEAYKRTSHGLSVVPDIPGPGWRNGNVTLRNPVESGWDYTPDDVA